MITLNRINKLDHERGMYLARMFMVVGVLAEAGRWMTARELYDRLVVEDEMAWFNGRASSFRQVRRWVLALVAAGVPIEIGQDGDTQGPGRKNYFRLRSHWLPPWLKMIAEEHCRLLCKLPNSTPSQPLKSKSESVQATAHTRSPMTSKKPTSAFAKRG